MEDASILLWIVGAVVAVIIFWTLVGYPKWRVWAAELNKKAAIIEAEAVAEQIKAIGTQLTTHDLYLRWQWIKMMEDSHKESTDNTIIYVPTEANIPILEAARLRKE